MPSARTLIDAGVRELGGLYASGQVSPIEACVTYLGRIERLGPALGAWLVVDAESAQRAAKASAARWAAAAPLSPLDGCPVGIKANIAVRGLPWHAGIEAYRGRVATADAACVARLRDAGAVILGLLNMDEGAFGATTDNPWFGRTHNPWKHGHTAGGSSGGAAAAVTAGLCAAALGTDTLGSVRIPAGLCGVFGHKPGRGTISTDGVVALSPSLDHVGVIARSVDDCAAVLGATSRGAGEMADRARLARTPLAALRLRTGDGVDAAVADAFEQTLAAARTAGLTVETVDLGFLDAETMRAAVLTMATEGASEHEAAISADPAGFSPAFLKRLGLAQRQGATAGLARSLRAAGEQARAALAGYSALLTPTSPRPAPTFDDDMRDAGILTALGNITGWPATAFPVGLSIDGLPLSVQALAADDAASLGVARLLARPLGRPPDGS